MRICIVNPGRCGGTLALCYLHSKLPGYEMKYEVITNSLPESKNIIFKYQYLYTHQPLEGADKYIVIDRKDKEAWLFSTYMSAVNKHLHGKVEGTFRFNSVDNNHSKLGTLAYFLAFLLVCCWFPSLFLFVFPGLPVACCRMT